MPEHIGQRIKRIRKKLDITQEQLATSASIKQATLSQIESGRNLPSIESLVVIAKALGVEPSDLMGEKTCPLCGFEYTYDEGLNSEAHRAQHEKAERIIAKYGFYWPYRQRQVETNRAYSVLADKKATSEQKYAAALILCQSMFSRSVMAYAYDDHPDFDKYVAMLIGNGAGAYPQIEGYIFSRLERQFGRVDGVMLGSYYTGSPVHQETMDPKLLAICNKLRFLPPEAVDVVAFICEQYTPVNK